MFHHKYTVYIWGVYTGRSLSVERFNLSSVVLCTVYTPCHVKRMTRCLSRWWLRQVALLPLL